MLLSEKAGIQLYYIKQGLTAAPRIQFGYITPLNIVQYYVFFVNKNLTDNSTARDKICAFHL